MSPAEAAQSEVSRARSGGLRKVLLCLGVALAVATVVTLRYAPRYTYWPGVTFFIPKEAPEYGRAKATLDQVADPWGPVTSPFHTVIGWRLFFPVIWHYAHLPAMSLLAMSQVGSILLLWVVAWLTYQRLGNWWGTLLTAALFTALPWFFVSSGWLTYFDSWLVLGLVVAALVRSRWAVAIACLLTPWIDERFVLVLPLTMLVRGAALGQIENRKWREVLHDLAVVTAASAPYLAIRAVVWLRGDPHATAYVQSHWERVGEVAATQFARGLWSGFRAAWLMIIAVVPLWARRVGWTWGLALAAVVAIYAVGGLFIAWDISRTMMVLCPVLLLGCWLWLASPPKSLRWLFPAIVVANLLLPADHILWFMEWPINSLLTVMRQAKQPFYVAGELLEEARLLAETGRFAEAREKLDASIKLYGKYARAYVRRSVLRMQAGDFAGADQDIAAALTVQPTNSDALFLRAAVRAERGEVAAAVDDLQKSLEYAPANWSNRAQAERALARGQQMLKAGNESRQP